MKVSSKPTSSHQQPQDRGYKAEVEVLGRSEYVDLELVGVVCHARLALVIFCF